MDRERLSVIISTHHGAENLQRCLRALEGQLSSADQLVIVHDGSLDGDFALAGSDCQVIHLDAAPNGPGSARNVGAHAAQGEILVFIEGDTIVRPGWAAALRSAFVEGACLVGGGIRSDGPPSLVGAHESTWRQHDQSGRNGFLPFVSGAHLAIRRDVFLRLGGFDERSPLSEDVDLSLRAQLAEYPVVFVPDADLVHGSPASVGGLLRQEFRRARADRMTELKFRKFPFMSLDNGGGVARAFGSSVAGLLVAGPEGDVRRLSLPLLHAGTAAAARLGTLAVDLQLLTGLMPLPGAVVYRDPEQHNTSSPLPGPPAFLLLGNDRLLMALLRLACESGDEVIVAPPGLEGEALAQWDQPAPWSLRLVRTAVRAGWPLALETAAKRLEREQPRTWGQAFLALHGVHAWAHGRPRYGLAALGPGGYELARRLPGVPIVIAGQADLDPDRVAVQVTRRRLLRDRPALAAELSAVIDPPTRGGVGVLQGALAR